MTEKERMKKLLLEMKHESLGLTDDNVIAESVEFNAFDIVTKKLLKQYLWAARDYAQQNALPLVQKMEAMRDDEWSRYNRAYTGQILEILEQIYQVYSGNLYAKLSVK